MGKGKSKKPKIKAIPANKKSDRINPGQPKDENLLFSFKYLDARGDFSLENCSDQFLRKLVERLKNFESLLESQLLSSSNKATRFHEIVWSDTAYRDGFTSLPRHLKGRSAHQFSISKAGGRVFGILWEGKFHIIWLDPMHKVYPMKN